MKIAKKVNYILFAGTIIGVGITGKIITARLHALATHSHTVDFRFSPAVNADITNYIETNKEFSKSRSFADLQTQFPYIKSLKIQRSAPAHTDYETIAHELLVTINNQQVVTDNGLVFNRELFAPRSVKFLYNIETVHQHSARVPEAFIDSMHAFMPDIVKAYTVTWIDDKEIVLHDKVQPLFFIKCSAKKLPDKQVLATCTRLMQEILQQLSEKKIQKVQQSLIADIRFDKQIILNGYKGG